MYAGTTVNWHEILLDRSTAEVNESLPLFLCAFSSDKGPEAITDLTYSDFCKYYGKTPDFFKYGQPLLQAHQILAAGGRVLGKRIVSETAKLANLIITATITEVTENKYNTNNQQLYLDGSGNETTTVTDNPVQVSTAKIKYEPFALLTATTVDQVKEYAKTLQTESRFPLFIICDNGRGKSVKKVKIAPDYNASRRLSYMYYNIYSFEGTDQIESQKFIIRPDILTTVNGVQKFLLLDNSTTVQFVAEWYTDAADAYIAKLSQITGYTADDLYGMDLLFAKTLKQTAISGITIDPDSTITLNATYGNALQFDATANGDFADAPFPGETWTENWAREAVKFFNGTFSDEIYDLDYHKIDFCVDANYPHYTDNDSLDVKGAISNLAIFREDFFYFRDLGLTINSMSDIESVVSNRAWQQSSFIGDYESSYQIIDTNTLKQIKVTMLHGVAPLLVKYYTGNISAPLAGAYNGFTITEAIKGTLNITPRVTPTYDQKQILDDLHVNYANYINNESLLTVQSTYTSQSTYGPLSFINNVLITQYVIKAIRSYCPKIRFMMMDPGETDFSLYKSLIEDNVIKKYTSYFNSISLVYTADEEMTANHVFNASLYCYYRNFAQAEVFDVFAVEGTPAS